MGLFSNAIKSFTAPIVSAHKSVYDAVKPSGNAAPGYSAPYGETVYGRPQSQFAINSAASGGRSSLAPTMGDMYADTGTTRPQPFSGSMRTTFSGGGNNMFGGGFNGNHISDFLKRYADRSNLDTQTNSPGIRWNDTTANQPGGVNAYRYAWEQPGFSQPVQSGVPAPTYAQQNALEQTPQQPMFDAPASSQPISNAESTQGWGFTGNNQPATFGQPATYNSNTQPSSGGYNQWGGTYAPQQEEQASSIFGSPANATSGFGRF